METLEQIKLAPQKKWLYRLGKHPRLKPYNRLFILVVGINLLLFYAAFSKWDFFLQDGWDLKQISRIALLNFALGIIIRQQYLINILFAVATSIPTSWPLWIRRICGKVYHFGGIHSSGTTMGTLWYLVFVAGVYYNFIQGVGRISVSLILLTSVILTLLVFIIIMALPFIRAKYHNNFEIAHRFGGWTALLLFWIQMLVFVMNDAPMMSLSQSLEFWILIVITVSVVLPWLRLKKVPIEVITPSGHVALTRFNYGVTPFAGSSTAISRKPLFEWHAFANVPAPGEDGFRLTISRAGDWTGSFINDRPKKIWVKGIPTAGVGNVDKLFKKVIWVATGSGIGPCIPHLLENYTPSILIWATRTPEETYGKELIDEIKAVQPQALIWNTDEKGKPDLVKLAYKAYIEFNAEAVICISNQNLTKKVVYEMESRGIPAYGAIWDS